MTDMQNELTQWYDGSIKETVHWRVRGPASSGSSSGVYAVSYESAEIAEAEARRDAPLCGVSIDDCIVLEITEWVKVTALRPLGDGPTAGLS